MTECRYEKPIETFDHGFRPEDWFEVDVLKHGRQALVDVNDKLGKINFTLNFTLLFKKKKQSNVKPKIMLFRTGL